MTRTYSPKLVPFVKDAEGYSQAPYKDAAGIWTAGYGHAFIAEVVRPLPPAEAEQVLRQDLAEAAAHVDKLVDVGLAPHEMDALTSFVFNLGAGRLATSTLLKRLNAGNRSAAAAEFERWVFAGGKRLNGLVKRRRAEAMMFSNGVY